MGIDSYTDTVGCVDAAHYRRADVYAPFFDSHAPPPDAGASDLARANDLASANHLASRVSDDGGCSTSGGSDANGWILLGAAAPQRPRVNEDHSALRISR